MMKPAIAFSILALSGALGVAGSGAAQSVVSTGQSFVEPALLVGSGSDGVRQAGISLRVKDGWKTYWRNPGEAGVPPAFDWSGSRNLASAEIGWPRPEVFDSFGFRTIGYSGEVVLPLKLVAQDASRPIDLALDLTLGVCREICIFEEISLETVIGTNAVGPDSAAIDAAESAIPLAGVEAGVTSAACRLTGTGEDRSFTAEVEFKQPLVDPMVALEGPEESWFQSTTTSHDGHRLTISSTLSLPTDSAWIDRSDLRITVLDANVTADIRGCAAG